MASNGFSRKRHAPGSTPSGYSQQMQQPANMYAPDMGQQLSDDQFLQWGQSNQLPNNFENTAAYGLNNNNSYSQNATQSSNQLTRRPMNQVVTRPKYDAPDNQAWPASSVGPPSAGDGAWGDDIEELEQKAQVAKKEAQAKRKQIPPFVQKLNSFLEDGKNTDLIRWSDDGNSFVVLDEDEFAKTLIPELFKHNNYASFVRQLNMYGFHKKVGLSDNSMRASERKNKSPSEYSNPYFRRGHPDLLWLIQKPKNASSGKKGKKQDAEAEEDVEEYAEEAAPPPDTRARPRPQLALGDGDSTLTQEQFTSIQRELLAIRQQQSQISRMMASLKREHEQLYGQAAQFQDQHSRHENSINAILTFLATVYNRSLQGHESAQSIQNLFSNAIPHDASAGTVVDVGDYNFDNLNGADPSASRPYKKPPLLLTDGNQPQGRASTMSPSASNSPFPSRQTRRSSQQPRGAPTPQAGNVEEVFDASTPTMPQGKVENNNDIMSVIQNTNARTPPSATTPAADFSSVLNSLETQGGNTPLSSSQRADMLRMMNSNMRPQSSRPGSSGVSSNSNDNALINANPPPYPANFDRQLQSTKADLDHLAKLQKEQDKSVQNLTNLLQPLSPSGSIPGLNDGSQIPNNVPPLDIDDFLNSSHEDYFANFPSDGDANYDFNNANTDFKYDDANDDELFAGVPAPNNANSNFGGNDDSGVGFGFDGANENLAVEGGGRVTSVASSEATTPQSVAEGDEGGARWRRNGKGRKLSSVGDEEEGSKRTRRR